MGMDVEGRRRKGRPKRGWMDSANWAVWKQLVRCIDPYASVFPLPCFPITHGSHPYVTIGKVDTCTVPFLIANDRVPDLIHACPLLPGHYVSTYLYNHSELLSQSLILES